VFLRNKRHFVEAVNPLFGDSTESIAEFVEIFDVFWAILFGANDGGVL
jgi:hypothetical protein